MVSLLCGVSPLATANMKKLAASIAADESSIATLQKDEEEKLKVCFGEHAGLYVCKLFGHRGLVCVYVPVYTACRCGLCIYL